jgi:ABC-type lipoprotein export system ATPase subunit
VSEAGLLLDRVTVRRSGVAGTGATLDGVSAAFPPGAVSAILGATGVGKSTLLHVLAALLRPDEGRVLAEGQPVSSWIAAHRDRWRRQVGLGFQAPLFLDGLTVLENVMAPRVPLERSIGAAVDQARAALEAAGVSHLADRPPSAISGGERQRVGLARALVGCPNYLVLDEPTAHQDDAGARIVVEAVQAAARRGAVVVVATHDDRIAPTIDRPWRLAQGRLAEAR